MTKYLCIAAVPIAAIVWLASLAHKGEPKLRAECEARGGVLISARQPLYACVGKPLR